MADQGLIIKIAADAKEFVSGADKAVKDVKSKFKGLGDEIGKELKRVHTVGTTAFQGIAGAIGAVVSGAGALITKGTAYNQNLEQQIKSLEILLGSTEKANQMMNELKEYDKISPFDLSQLAEASKQMLAYGIETDKVIPMLKMFGDISMGNQDKVLALALAFSQCSATGKLMGQDLNQMINAGFNPLEYISRQTGKSVAQLKEEMADGAITVQMVEDAFKMATSEGERFYKATEKGSQTVQGRMSILEADFEAFCGQIAEGFTKTFGEEILPLAEDYMDRISKAFTEGGFNGLIVELGVILGELVDKVVQELPKLIDAGVKIVNAILKGILSNLFQIQSGAEQIIKKLLEGIRMIMPKILTIAQVIVGTIAEGFVQYEALIMEMGIQIITALAKGLADAAPTLAPKIVEILLGLLDVLIENLPTFLQSLLTILQELTASIMDRLPELCAKIGQVVYDAIDWFCDNLPEILDVILQLVIALGAMLAEAILAACIAIGKNLVGWWNDKAKPWFDNIGKSISDFFSFIGEVISLWWNTIIKPFFVNIKHKISEWWENVKRNVSEKVENIKTAVSEKVNSIKEGVVEKVNSLKQSLTDKVNAIKESVTNFLSNLRETVSTRVSEIVENFVSFWQNLPGKMLDIGRNLIEGLWNGISNAKDWLFGKISELCGNVTGWFKNLFGINSPSKVFAEIGGYLTDGLAIGLDNETDMLKAAARDQVNQLTGVYNGVDLGSAKLNIATPTLNPLSRITGSIQSVTNEGNTMTFFFENHFSGDGAGAADELFRQFQRKVRYSGGTL